jgi:hypothetical protein
MIPGTSCLANIVLSLRDKSHSPIEAPHNYLSAYEVKPGLGYAFWAPWALQFGHFLVRIPSARRTNGKQPRASALGKVRRLALPKQDRIMLPAGLDILDRPKGENRIAHGLQPWEDGPERNRPERAAEGRSLFPKITFVRKRLDGVSEAHEALPDTKICGDARPDRKCRR